ncbi:MAG: hypothetical protein ACR2GY_08430, partial [Phycisphaerales bacterium]
LLYGVYEAEFDATTFKDGTLPGTIVDGEYDISFKITPGRGDALGDERDNPIALTRQPIRVTWPQETAGKTIAYFGRWITTTGKEGPWSLPVSMQIAFGGAALAAIDAERSAIRAAA